MSEVVENRLSSRQGLVHLIIGVLIFGSVWGFLEATLGGFLNLIIFPNKGAIMSSIGMAIMASALAVYQRPAMLPCIGVVAASFKWLNSWLLFVPINSIQIINPATAIILESLAFALVAVFLMDKIADNVFIGTGAGVLVGLLSATAYVCFAIYVMKANLLGRVVTSTGAFITNQGVVQAAFFGILLPLGYQIGKRLAAISPVSISRPLYYTASAAIIGLCWVLSAVAVRAGL